MKTAAEGRTLEVPKVGTGPAVAKVPAGAFAALTANTERTATATGTRPSAATFRCWFASIPNDSDDCACSPCLRDNWRGSRGNPRLRPQ